MKNGARQILGKTIRAVCIKRQTLTVAKMQLFLTFTDGSVYEFYTDGSGNLANTSGLLPPGFDVATYMPDGSEIVWQAEL